MRNYYEAYDDRYRQVHEKQLQWASDTPSVIVSQVIEKYAVSREARVLELGCGEGRDAGFLLQKGYDLTATDISVEAIRYCREKWPEYADCFQVLDCIGGALEEAFDFIYAVAVIHMLVEDPDRMSFYQFIRDHLQENGIALICTMGDGTVSRKSDVSTAFDLQKRIHMESGRELDLAGTSCRMVLWEEFLCELDKCGLRVMEHGLTAVEPDFPVMMYAVLMKYQTGAV